MRPIEIDCSVLPDRLIGLDAGMHLFRLRVMPVRHA